MDLKEVRINVINAVCSLVSPNIPLLSIFQSTALYNYLQSAWHNYANFGSDIGGYLNDNSVGPAGRTKGNYLENLVIQHDAISHLHSTSQRYFYVGYKLVHSLLSWKMAVTVNIVHGLLIPPMKRCRFISIMSTLISSLGRTS